MDATRPTAPRSPRPSGSWPYLKLRREPWFVRRRAALLALLLVIVPCLAVSFHTQGETRLVLRLVALGAFALFALIGAMIRRRYLALTAPTKTG